MNEINTLIVIGLPWIISAVTVWMTILTGNMDPRAWSIGFVNQVLWLIWVVADQAWGLIPLNLALWVVYIRNHRKWNASRA